MNKLPLFTAINGSELAVKGLETAVYTTYPAVRSAAMAVVKLQVAVDGHRPSHDGQYEPMAPPIRP